MNNRIEMKRALLSVVVGAACLALLIGIHSSTAQASVLILDTGGRMQDNHLNNMWIGESLLHPNGGSVPYSSQAYVNSGYVESHMPYGNPYNDLSIGTFRGYAKFGSLGASAYASAVSQEVHPGDYSYPWTNTDGVAMFLDNVLITDPFHGSGDPGKLSVLVGLTGTALGDDSGAWITVNGQSQVAMWTVHAFMIDFHYNEWTDLMVELRVWARAGAHDGSTRSSYAGYYDTATVGGFEVFELDGITPVTGVSYVTASGHDYQLPISAAVPGPASAVLLGAGFVGVLLGSGLLTWAQKSMQRVGPS